MCSLGRVPVVSRTYAFPRRGAVDYERVNAKISRVQQIVLYIRAAGSFRMGRSAAAIHFPRRRPATPAEGSGP